MLFETNYSRYGKYDFHVFSINILDTATAVNQGIGTKRCFSAENVFNGSILSVLDLQ